MEPPPMCSVWLENEDGGLLLTSRSISSESASRCQLPAELPDSGTEEKLSSTLDLFDRSDRMCNANFNKATAWPGLTSIDCDSKHLVAIKPPPQFQDSPPETKALPSSNEPAWLEKFASRLARDVCEEARRRPPPPPYHPPHRPGSRGLSSSHGSLTANKADDSSFITSAMSHDVLVDVYAVPVDVVRPPPHRPRRRRRRHRGRRHVEERPPSPDAPTSDPGRRRSAPSSSGRCRARCDRPEPIHMTLQEVRRYLHNLYSSSSDSSEHRPKVEAPALRHHDDAATVNNNNVRKHTKNTFVINIKNKKAKESCEIRTKDNDASADFNNEKDKLKKNPGGRLGFSSNLKQTLCNIFRIRKPPSPEHGRRAVVLQVVEDMDVVIETKAPFLRRALPPLPAHPALDPADRSPAVGDDPDDPDEEPSMDFASSIEKVKDYGWYWGPISGEAAEKILSNEPDGSFIVRDSSDDHYIFSLTFKLNACIRHVRIEHDQGNFSFGSCTKFKSHTIVDFIENAVEHSRSGRYLFFLHRRPVLGPMRVQLLHPVSRFKQVQSLQHMCRFVILKLVRKDLINTLPLPRRVIDYLSTPHYYSEQLVEDDSGSDGASPSPDRVVHVLSFVPQGLS